MEYEQFEAYKGGHLNLRELDNTVRRLVGLYGASPVTFKSTKAELTILVGRPKPAEDQPVFDGQTAEVEQRNVPTNIAGGNELTKPEPAK